MDISQLPLKYQQQIAEKLLIAEREKLAEKEKNKYNAEKTTYDGKTFDSKKEANRYAELSLLQKTGQISELQTQIPFELLPSQKLPTGKTERGIRYIADFVYLKDGQVVVEDVKGYKKGPAYSIFTIKRKLMYYFYGIVIQEV